MYFFGCLQCMNLSINDGARTLDITIKGYEFSADELNGKPEYVNEGGMKVAADAYDYNWLNLGFRFTDGSTVRECVDPCILTWEYGDIISGLEELLSGGRSHFDEEEIWLMEPVMRFKADTLGNGTFKVEVGLWPEGKMGEDVDCVIVEQTVTEAELKRIVAMLRLGRRLFPERSDE